MPRIRQDSVSTRPEASVQIKCGNVALDGDLTIPRKPIGLVIFAHGSGGSRHSPRNVAVARALNTAGLASLLLDLLTREEELADSQTMEFRFNIDLLSQRLVRAIEWSAHSPRTSGLSVGIFGASTGAAAALIAASKVPDRIRAVVSRGGRPDLAGSALPRVAAPTLLIVGGNDAQVLALNQSAMSKMQCRVKLEVIAGATHLFEEPGALDAVAELARNWFAANLQRA